SPFRLPSCVSLTLHYINKDYYLHYVIYDSYIFFFFQAEDGIRDFHVTGVQTCALPIFLLFGLEPGRPRSGAASGAASFEGTSQSHLIGVLRVAANRQARSQAGDLNTQGSQSTHQVHGGGFALKVRVSG